MRKSRTFLEERKKLMRNIIKLLSLITVTTLTLISCAAGVQTTGVNTNATTTTSSDSTTYENYEPVNITESNATENTNYTDNTSKYGVLSSVLSSVDFTSLFAGIGSKLKEAAKDNSGCGQCTGSGCSNSTLKVQKSATSPFENGQQIQKLQEQKNLSKQQQQELEQKNNQQRKYDEINKVQYTDPQVVG